MPSIEMATAEDLPEIIRLNMLALEELRPSLSYDPEIEEVSQAVHSNWKQAPCFILTDEKIIGFAGLMLTKAYFSPFPFLKDYMFYILPEHRNTRNLGLLCKAARDFARHHGVPLVLNYIVNKRPESHMRLMQRMGFKVSGITGVYNG